MAAVFAWLDIKDMRSTDSKAFAILNDSERDVPPSVMEALESYEVKPVAWSRREVVVPELTA
jgi:hypothetical protein